MSASINQSYENQLAKLQEQLLDMGKAVMDMLDKSVTALEKQDAALADEVIKMDDSVDDMDVEIEQNCMRLLSLQRPQAHHLRTIGTAMNLIIDLERMGDHSVDLAKIAKRLSKEPFYKPLIDIPKLAMMVRLMVKQSLDAFVQHDMNLVIKVCQDDDQVDAFYNRLFHELLETMKTHPENVVQCTYLLFVARFLERIADHATNIAERVAYMETGVLQQLVKSHMPRSKDQEQI